MGRNDDSFAQPKLIFLVPDFNLCCAINYLNERIKW